MGKCELSCLHVDESHYTQNLELLRTPSRKYFMSIKFVVKIILFSYIFSLFKLSKLR